MKQIKHLSTNIEGLLRNYTGRKINIFTDDDGNTMSDYEVREQIT